MYCSRCGNTRALFLKDNEGCNKCFDPKREEKNRNRKVDDIPSRFRDLPVIAVGMVTGIERRYKNIAAAAKKYGATPRTVFNIINGRQSGKNVGWKFKFDG